MLLRTPWYALGWLSTISEGKANAVESFHGSMQQQCPLAPLSPEGAEKTRWIP
ncbi:hypothetical protein BDW71DRAFT_174258 [Aspergillus fruticulosus]